MSTTCHYCHGQGSTINYTTGDRITCGHCGGSGLSPKARGTGTCFPASTLVKTSCGQKQVGDLCHHDLVLSYNKNTNTVQEMPVLRVIRYPKQQIWELVTSNGKIIRTTGSHSFWSEGDWKKASQIEIHDSLTSITLDGTSVNYHVLRSCPVDQYEDVFKIIVDKNFTLLAEGFLAHSFTNFRNLQILYWTALSYGLKGFRRHNELAQETS